VPPPVDPRTVFRRRLDRPAESTLALLHELEPFRPGPSVDRVMSALMWLRRCNEAGLVTVSEYYDLVDAIKRSEGIY